MRDISPDQLHADREEMETLVQEHGLGDVVDPVLEASFNAVLEEISANLALLELPRDLLKGRQRPLATMISERINRTRERLEHAIHCQMLRLFAMHPQPN